MMDNLLLKLPRMHSWFIFLILVLLTTTVLSSQGARSLFSDHVMLSDGSGRQDKMTCNAKGICQALEVNTCLDVTLPYKHTSLHPLFSNQSQVIDFMSRFEGLRKVPRCWTAFETIICPTFLPRCEPDDQEYFLPTQDMCRNAKSHCRLIQPLISHLCSNESLFPNNCLNRYQDLKFANPSQAKCPGPLLVATEDTKVWFKGIEGCAFNCSDHRFSAQDKKNLENFIYYGFLLTAVVCLVSALTFIKDWKDLHRYPSVIIFYLCICILGVSVSFLIQFFMTSKESIACNSDSTVRHSVPESSDHNGACTWSFLLLYYFGIKGLIWFVFLGIDCHRYFASKNRSYERCYRENQQKDKSCSYQLFAWLFPLICVVVIFATNSIDGSFVTGVCSVGLNDWTKRLIFVLMPIFVAVVIGQYFYIQCIWTLVCIHRTTQVKDPSMAPLQATSLKERSKIIMNIINFGILAVGSLIVFIVIVVSNIIEYRDSDSWSTELANSVICSLNISNATLPGSSMTATEGYLCSNTKLYQDFQDKIGTNSSMSHIFAQIGCIFAAGVFVFVWTWKACLLFARSSILKALRAPDDKKYIKKDVIMARAKGDKNADHDARYLDPLGINLTPVASDQVSLTFLEGLQKVISKRGDSEKTRGFHGKTSRKMNAFFKRSFRSLYDGDASSVSEAVFASHDVSNSVASDSRATSRLSLEETKELQEFVRRKRKKLRHRNGEALRMMTRKDSDTSTQSLASHSFMLPAARSVSQSILNARQQNQESVTRQETLQQQPQQPVDVSLQMLAFYQNILAGQMATQSITDCPSTSVADNLVVMSQQNNNALLPSLALKANTHGHHDSQCPSRIRKEVHDRIADESQGFTHGMIEQKEQLSNPFIEKRKPDSKVPYLQQNVFPISFADNNLALMNNSFLQQPNLFQTQPFNAPFGQIFPPNPCFQPLMFPQAFGMSSHPQLMPPYLLPHPMTGGRFNLKPVFPQTNLITNEINGTLSSNLAVIQQQPQDIHEPQSPIDLQLMNRQRAELDPLIQAMDSGSEVCSNIIPVMSDSEGFFTDGGEASGFTDPSNGDKKNNSNLMIKQEVEERIQRIEAAAEAASNNQFDVNCNEKESGQNSSVATAGNVFHISSDRRPKSLEETSSHQRSKKKSSSFKKHHQKIRLKR